MRPPPFPRITGAARDGELQDLAFPHNAPIKNLTDAVARDETGIRRAVRGQDGLLKLG
jgi:hypothetical protein